MFLFAFVSGASTSFSHLFLRSLNEIHRSFAIAHALIHPIFIHKMFLFLGLDDFPTGKPVHIIAPIGVTFLRQRVAHLRVGPICPRGASSGVVPSPSSSTGPDTAEASGAGAADANVPPPTTLDDSNIQRMLDHVFTVQAAHGQILVDVLDEIRGLRAELAQFRRSSPPPPFDDGFFTAFWHSVTKRGSTFLSTCRCFCFQGEIFLSLEPVEIRLYLGASCLLTPKCRRS